MSCNVRERGLFGTSFIKSKVNARKGRCMEGHRAIVYACSAVATGHVGQSQTRKRVEQV